MKTLDEDLTELMWPSITIDINTSMRDRHDIYEWCYDTFGMSNFVMEKNRLYFRQEKYITLFRMRFS
jgi:hypothetical protein